MRERQPREGLALLPRVAVLPHFDDFGERWIDSATAELEGRDATLLGVDFALRRRVDRWGVARDGPRGGNGDRLWRGAPALRTGEEIIGLASPRA